MSGSTEKQRSTLPASPLVWNLIGCLRTTSLISSNYASRLWMAVFHREFPARHEIYCVQETPVATHSRKEGHLIVVVVSFALPFNFHCRFYCYCHLFFTVVLISILLMLANRLSMARRLSFMPTSRTSVVYATPVGPQDSSGSLSRFPSDSFAPPLAIRSPWQFIFFSVS
jgi:hypothetical protein